MVKKVIAPEQEKYDVIYEKILFNKITEAFSWRERPKDMWELSFETATIIMPDDEIALKQFLGKNWQDITLDIYVNYDDALYVFTPSAYAYYLPGLLITSAKAMDIAIAEDEAIVRAEAEAEAKAKAKAIDIALGRTRAKVRAKARAMARAEALAKARAIGDKKARIKGFINIVVFWIMDFEKILSDSYLFKRWATLTIEEYLAVKAWLIWITREDTYQDDEDIYQNDESVCQNNVMNSLISLDKLIGLAKQREK
ncbi:hypothetical protein A9G42_08620 [Gilliamella sp. Nev6-6]|uniref:hypothetical protein n=2 Tax=Gilliamella sp. Nev6-6 TaxID=3120252 RepID=UPI00080F43AF|nr:hypothetical protein [Gilliamella apicola]OCG76021.1 hypothetical protein A9G42_08620 [Gilliamella apicola]